LGLGGEEFVVHAVVWLVLLSRRFIAFEFHHVFSTMRSDLASAILNVAIALPIILNQRIVSVSHILASSIVREALLPFMRHLPVKTLFLQDMFIQQHVYFNGALVMLDLQPLDQLI
jgi:hypothetical protein